VNQAERFSPGLDMGMTNLSTQREGRNERRREQGERKGEDEKTKKKKRYREVEDSNRKAIKEEAGVVQQKRQKGHNEGRGNTSRNESKR